MRNGSKEERLNMDESDVARKHFKAHLRMAVSRPYMAEIPNNLKTKKLALLNCMSQNIDAPLSQHTRQFREEHQ